MFCRHCGNEIPQDGKFCGRCGAPAEPFNPPVYHAVPKAKLPARPCYPGG